MISVGFEKGDVFHLPYSGGTLEQPNKTLKCWMICRSEFLEYISDQNKKQAQKMASKSRRR